MGAALNGNLMNETDQQSLDVGTFEFGEPPPTVRENVKDMNAVMAARRAANLKTAMERDTERYLVIVYRDRAAREAVLSRLGLSTDERYLLGDAVELSLRDGKGIADAVVFAERDCRVTDIAHSGEAG